VHAAAEGTVRPPAADRPALADPTTATLMNMLTRRTRSVTSSFAYLPLYVMSWAWMFIPGLRIEPGLVVMAAATIACSLFAMGQATYVYVRCGRWLRKGERLLRAQSWRPVPAVVTGRGTVEINEDGRSSRLRAPGMYDAVAQVIVRTGRVWVVGPDARGWLALRVDGLHAPWPARRVGAGTGSAAREPVAPGTTGTAAYDPVAASWARTAVRLLLLPLLPYVFFIAVFAATAVGLAMVTHVVVPWVIFAMVFIVPCVILLMIKLRRSRAHRRLPALLRAGPWRRVRIQIWPGRTLGWTGTANTTGTVWLEDGSTLKIALPGASIDLLGTIGETGTLWLAGEPAPGRSLAAGFPGYQLLGVALLS
jgi:hypothetical protein